MRAIQKKDELGKDRRIDVEDMSQDDVDSNLNSINEFKTLISPTKDPEVKDLFETIKEVGVGAGLDLE